jgi:predicted O-methyltransferase YrrM
MASPARLRPSAVLERVYDRGFVVGRRGGRFEVHPTGIDPMRGEQLRQIVAKEAPAATIETGFGYGLSSLFVCQGLLDSGRESFRHVVMDPLQDSLFEDAGLVLFEEGGIESLLEFHRSGSELVLPRLLEQERRFDFAFVDGDHRFESAFLDLYYMVRLVRPGGLIAVDDMWMPSVRMAVDYWVSNVGLEHENARPPRRDRFREHLKRILSSDGRPDPAARSGQDLVALLRVPQRLGPREWDHFEPFGYDY